MNRLYTPAGRPAKIIARWSSPISPGQAIILFDMPVLAPAVALFSLRCLCSKRLATHAPKVLGGQPHIAL